VNGFGAADDFWYPSMRKPPQIHSLERKNVIHVSQPQPLPR